MRVGLRDWVESWRWLRRWDWNEKRVFVGRGKRKKQVPRRARNDNLGAFRHVAEVWPGRVEEPDHHRSSRSNRDAKDRPLLAERTRRSWGVKECAAMGLAEVARGGWRVTSLKKKQVPRCARNDNAPESRRAVGHDPHRSEDRL